MTKVYVVTCSVDYEGGDVESVFSTKVAADERCKGLKEKCRDKYIHYKVDEFTVDEVAEYVP